MGGRVIYYFSAEHTIKKIGKKKKEGRDLYVGHWGGHALYIFDQGKPFEPDRVISCIKENGGWKFDQFGKPLPFEDTRRYTLPRKQDRFDAQLLRDYLKAMGLYPYEAAFFRVSEIDPGVLVERTDSGSEKEVIVYLDESTIKEKWYMELCIPLQDFKSGDGNSPIKRNTLGRDVKQVILDNTGL